METVGADAVVPPRRSWRAPLRARPRRRVRLGRGVRIGQGVVLRAGRGARLVLGDGVAVGDGARIEAVAGELRVGAGSALGERCSLYGSVSVGSECVVGEWARVEGAATLEDRARLAAHAVALTGARVGRGAVIGSYAVVEGRVAPGAVVGRQTRAPRSSS
jgi:carbonic anhydrase/acetyltransferase-like protein (isoleucine patch superfamily)